jgi:conjugative transfer region protein TrbK
MPEQDKLFRRFPLIAAIGLVVLFVAACAVQLRPDQDSQPSAATPEDNHPLAPKLESCLTVTPRPDRHFRILSASLG